MNNEIEFKGTFIGSDQDTSTQCNMVMDYGSLFTTDKIFNSRDDLLNWCRKVGKENGMVIVTVKSDKAADGKRPRLTLGCERGGSYRKFYKKVDKKVQEGQLKKRKFVGTKKCGCPFALKGEKLATNDDWKLMVSCGVHNHSLAIYLEGHSYAGRLTNDENSLLIHLSKSMVPPKQILDTLKKKDKSNKTTIKTIYNARLKNKVKEKAGRSQMQYLLSKLAEHNYIEYHTSNNQTDIVENLFVDLLRIFSSVLIMDCTYKTVRYGLPLLQIIGVTSTDMTFSVANIYLSSERTEDYKWALDRLHDLMKDCCVMPNVIVSDRELALMKAIEIVFPTCRHLLCRWHISKNVLTNCRKEFDTTEMWEKFDVCWGYLVLSSTENQYNERLNGLKNEFKTYPKALEYVQNSWLIPYKERFVAAWTDTCMHRGSNTSNRAESAHSQLKSYLKTCKGSFDNCWEKMHGLFELTLVEIKASFERSRMVSQHEFAPSAFGELRTFISLSALQELLDEYKRAKKIGVDVSACGCALRKTHGLPCAHEIAEYMREGRPIPLDCIHSLWRKLDMEHTTAVNSEIPLLIADVDVKLFLAHFDHCDTIGKVQALKKLREIHSPHTSALMEPLVKVKTKGRPTKGSKIDTSCKRDPSGFEYVESQQDSYSPNVTQQIASKKRVNKVVKQEKPQKIKVQKRPRTRLAETCLGEINFLNQFPQGMREHIERTDDVESDGNCRFRAIACLMSLDGGENAWDQVRIGLWQELNANSEVYMKLYGSNERVQQLKNALYWFGSSPAPTEKWMTIPDMGHIIASYYNVVLYCLSIGQCSTFLPLRSNPEPMETRKHIAIGFINKNHFVQVFLRPGHPVPPIHSSWYYNHDECAEGWDTAYIKSIETFHVDAGFTVVSPGSIQNLD